MIWLVDASVALKWFVEEDGAELASRLLEQTDPIEAPDLVLAELYNAAWRLRRIDTLASEQYDGLLRDAPGFFSRLHPIAPLACRAARIGHDLGHPIYDCFYVALAEARGARVVTADQRFLKRVAESPWRGLAIDMYALPS